MTPDEKLSAIDVVNSLDDVLSGRCKRAACGVVTVESNYGGVWLSVGAAKALLARVRKLEALERLALMHEGN